MNKIRLKYEKEKNVKYIGHLDTITMFDRAFRRSKIDIKFTNGFNKRACFVFALPTATGIESKCEYMEFEVLDDNIDTNEIKQKLNNVLPTGFKILDVYIINDKKSIMAKVIESEYLIDIYVDGKESVEKYKEKIEELFNKEEIQVKKKSKDDSIKYIDIKPYIIDITIQKDGENVQIYLKAKAGSSANLRPEYIINAIENIGINVIDYNILRANLILDE